MTRGISAELTRWDLPPTPRFGSSTGTTLRNGHPPSLAPIGIRGPHDHLDLNGNAPRQNRGSDRGTGVYAS